MSDLLPACPICQSVYTYEMGALLVCPECAHEWIPDELEASQQSQVKDSSGNVLQDGDSVTIVKDLKVKGSSTSIKVGTKVKNIRLITPKDGHDIDAKVPGFGQMLLKSEVVRRASE